MQGQFIDNNFSSNLQLFINIVSLTAIHFKNKKKFI